MRWVVFQSDFMARAMHANGIMPEPLIAAHATGASEPDLSQTRA